MYHCRGSTYNLETQRHEGTETAASSPALARTRWRFRPGYCWVQTNCAWLFDWRAILYGLGSFLNHAILARGFGLPVYFIGLVLNFNLILLSAVHFDGFTHILKLRFYRVGRCCLDYLLHDDVNTNLVDQAIDNSSTQTQGIALFYDVLLIQAGRFYLFSRRSHITSFRQVRH